jgi:prepilin-type N-terminal cleavage/methylation domain-containing protein
VTTRLDRDRGFTLVEVLVAVLILAILAVGAASLGVAANRAIFSSRAASTTAALARQKHEQLRALTWAVTEAGVAVTDTTADVSGATPASGGPGRGVAPPGALDANLPGFSDYLDVNGRWVGAGPSPPPAAAYARRWSVDHLTGSGGATLLARVVVIPIGWAAERRARGASAVLASEAALVSMRTRTAR